MRDDPSLNERYELFAKDVALARRNLRRIDDKMFETKKRFSQVRGEYRKLQQQRRQQMRRGDFEDEHGKRMERVSAEIKDIEGQQIEMKEQRMEFKQKLDALMKIKVLFVKELEAADKR